MSWMPVEPRAILFRIFLKFLGVLVKSSPAIERLSIISGGTGPGSYPASAQIASATLRVDGLLRGLFVLLSPSHIFASPISPPQPGQGEIKAFSLGLSAVYFVS